MSFLEDWERVPDRDVPCPPFTGGLPWDGRSVDPVATKIARLHRVIHAFPHHELQPVWQNNFKTLLRRKHVWR